MWQRAAVAVVIAAVACFAAASAHAAAPANTAAPTISGTAAEGYTLTASTGTWTNGPTGYAYQWQKCPGTTFSDTALGDGPVGYWRLDDLTTASNAADATSNGNTGTYNGGVTVQYAPGAITSQADKAANFNGSTGYVSIPSSSSLNSPTHGLTIEAWIKTSLSQTEPIVLKSYTSHNPPYYQYGLFQSGTGLRLDLATNGSNDRAYYFSSGQSITLGSWNYVVATWDGSTVRFYINGAAAGSSAATGTISTFSTPVDLATYENLRGSSSYFWGGAIDEVAIYDHALTATQVGNHYTSAAPSTNCTDIAGATAATYTAQAGDVGSVLRVRVTASNADGSGTSTSSSTSVVAAAGTLPVNTSLPTITGTTTAGSTLTASTGTWNGNPTVFTYSWLRCDAGGGTCAVLDSTSSTYVLGNDDVGLALRVVVAASNSRGADSATSNPTSRIGRSGSPSTEAYLDSSLDGQLKELLLARWPNHYSAAESALGTTGGDLAIRRELLRARIAAKTMPDLAMLPALKATDGVQWKISRSFGGGQSDIVWLEFAAHDLGFGTADNADIQEWCPSGAPQQPAYADPCRRTYSGLWGQSAAWVVGYHTGDNPPSQGTQSIINCDSDPVMCGEPPNNDFRRSVYLNYGPGGASDTWLTRVAYDYLDGKVTYFRELTPNEMWLRLWPDRFEQFTTQTVTVSTNWTVPSTIDLATARAALQLPELSDARHWIDGQLDPNASSSSETNAELEARYAPELHYDVQETYRADSAAEITDNETSTTTNKLLDGAETVMAATDPSLVTGQSPPPDFLTLDYLNDLYPPNTQFPMGRTADELDHIDEADNYAADGQRLHASSLYANKTYSRVVSYPDGEKVLEYWFFYYYNSKTFDTIGAHEGDWEMIQVHLDANQAPTALTYSQHRGGERCDWSVAPHVYDHPVVYVGEGSHANYFTTGSHEVLPGGYDYSRGDGEINQPSLVDTAIGSYWLNWPGHWGGTSGSGTPFGQDSPRGPKQHSQWSDPLGWENDAKDCTISQSFRRSGPTASTAPAATPTNPIVTARRVGSRVRIAYRFPARVGDRTLRSWQLVTSVVSPNPRLVPLTIQTRVKGRRGTIAQPVGLGRGKLHLLVSVRARDGRRSQTISVPIR